MKPDTIESPEAIYQRRAQACAEAAKLGAPQLRSELHGGAPADAPWSTEQVYAFREQQAAAARGR